MAESNFINAKKAVDQLTEALRLHMEMIDKSVISLNKLNKEYTELPSDYVKTQKQILDLRRQEERAEQELIKTLQQLERLKQQEHKTDVESQKIKQQSLKIDQESERVKQQTLRTDQSIERSKQQQQRTLASESRTRQTLVREQQQQVRISQREKKTVDRANSAYLRLRDSLNRAEKEYREFAVAQGLSSKSTIAAQTNVRRLRQQLDAINAPINRMNDNVGNYPKNFSIAAGAVRSLVGAFGLIEGVRMGWRLMKESMDLAREAKGVEFAFKRLGEAGVKAFDDVKQASRGSISDLDIKRALVDFDNFNIDLEQAGVLFEFLTVRATQTGKSFDYLRDSLVEGLSKESKLRIDNLGISASVLNEELEKTPNFVEAVANIARTEVAEAGDILDEAGNSMQTFASATENAKLAFGQLLTAGNTSFIGIVSRQIDKMTRGFKLLRIGVEMVQQGWERLTKPIKETISEIPILQKYFSFLSKFWQIAFTPALNMLADLFMRLGANMAGIGGAITSLKSTFMSLLQILSMLSDIEIDFMNPKKTADQAKAILSIAKATLGNAGKNAAQAYRDEYDKVFRSGIKTNQEMLEEEEDEIEKNNDAKVKYLKGSLAYWEAQLKNLQEEQKNLATNSEEYKEYEQRITAASLALQQLKERLQGTATALKVGVDTSELEAMDAFFKELNEVQKRRSEIGISTDDINAGLKKELEDQRKIEADKTRIVKEENQRRVDIVFSSLEKFGESYGVDLGAFRTLFDGKKNTISDYALAAQEVLGFALNQRLSTYDMELQKAAETRDAILNNERSTEKQRQAAEKQYAKQEAKIKNERAKKERQNALIEIAVNTAIGVTKALSTTPPPASFVLAGIITAFGALQAGLVASQPLPKFEKGTDNAPGGWAIVDEKGPELHTSRTGRIKSTGSTGGANLRYLEKGDKIFPADTAIGSAETFQLQSMLWNAGINLSSTSEPEKDNSVLNEIKGLRKDNRSLKKTISGLANRPINVNINDKPNPYYG